MKNPNVKNQHPLPLEGKEGEIFASVLWKDFLNKVQKAQSIKELFINLVI